MKSIALGVEEIHNLLHNNQKERVARYIGDHAMNVAGSLQLLDYVLYVRETYAERLAAGMPFTVAFNDFYLNQKSTRHAVPKMPARMKNFSKAIFRFIVEGMPTETKESALQRLAICETNECGYFDGSICRHQNCGCFTKIKTFLTTEHCPLNKW